MNITLKRENRQLKEEIDQLERLLRESAPLVPDPATAEDEESALLLAPEESTSATETAHEDVLQIVERA